MHISYFLMKEIMVIGTCELYLTGEDDQILKIIHWIFSDYEKRRQ